ncbi:hypothetical protein GCM10008934_02580 [Virgibacillus salarius]
MYQWKVSEYRKDKRVGALSPVKRSDYVQSLFKVGAGFNEQKTSRKSNLSIPLEKEGNGQIT